MPTTNNMPTSTNMPTNDDDMLNDVLIDDPVLYISKVPYSMTDTEVMDILKEVSPARYVGFKLSRNMENQNFYSQSIIDAFNKGS